MEILWLPTTATVGRGALSQRLQHLFDELWDQQRTLVLLVDDHGDDVVAVQEGGHIVLMMITMMMTMVMRMTWMTFPNSSSHGE